MKNPIRLHDSARAGYVTFLMVLGVAIVAFALLLASFRVTLRTQDNQMLAQMRVDASAREGAILRALVNIVPNRAIYCMTSDSSLNPTPATWERIFADALVAANAEDADADGIAAGLDFERVANPSAFSARDVSSIFSAIGGEPGVMSPGINRTLGAQFPPYLTWSGPGSAADAFAADALHPIITEFKQYGANASGVAQLSPALYPLFNRVPYPNIRFGYAEPGEGFVAKRNWWAFSLRFPEEVPGLGGNTKRYVLSIYEVPSQLPISSSSELAVGAHADGSTWSGIEVDGGIFGERITAEGAPGADRLASRFGMDLSSGVTVGGTSVTTGFDSGNTMLEYERQHDRYFPVSVAAGAGRISFIALNRGMEFYELASFDYGLNAATRPLIDSNTISPTGWNAYARGAEQCAMRLTIEGVAAADEQIPTVLRLSFVRKNGSIRNREYARVSGGNLWVRDDDVPQTSFPFRVSSNEVASGRPALIVNLGELQDFIEADDGAGPEINHSLAINPNPSGDNVVAPSFPSGEDDLAVVIRDSRDMREYTNGFALVSNLRVYFGEDLNVESAPVPVGSGLAAPYHPPVAVFAPEKRWGVENQSRPIVFQGTVAGVDAGSGEASRPVDFRTGNDNLSGGTIRADLNTITSPAALPPVRLMNWLITIEEAR